MMAGTVLITLVKANGYIPTANTRIEIDNPTNKTYTNNTISLEFYVWQAFRWLNFFYRLDGNEMKAIENLTVTHEFDLNPAKNPSFIVTNLRGNCILSNLSEGWHNVTVYQIGDFPADSPEDGEILRSATTDFFIGREPPPSPQFPIPFVATVTTLTVVIIAGLLIYARKRSRQAHAKKTKIDSLAQKLYVFSFSLISL
jgi:hypothetical protein